MSFLTIDLKVTEEFGERAKIQILNEWDVTTDASLRGRIYRTLFDLNYLLGTPQIKELYISASTEGMVLLFVAASKSFNELLGATKSQTIAPVEAEI
jgi:hypothetical protein